jgi:Predicted integral membrane protein
LPPLFWAVVILIGTSWPSISVGPDAIIGLDKVVHFSMYAVFAGLLLRYSPAPYERRTFVLALLGVALFGALDEWHQQFIPSRSMSIYDWIADVLGACFGLLAVRFIPQLAPPRQAPGK